VSDSIVLDRVEFAAVRVNERTEWGLAEVFDRDGASAVAEFVERAGEPNVADLIAELVGALAGKSLASDESVADAAGVDESRFEPFGGPAIAVSAVRSAVTILQAVHAGVSLTEQLGGSPKDSVELYANINRALLGGERSPAGFGRMAERMAARGFRTIKCAPFDEVDASKTGPDAVRAARIGIERVAAVRSAIGPDVRLLVDCHRRFDLESALVVADELSRLEIGWFEEPVDTETEQDDMAEIARRVSMPVAGGESLYGVAAFEGLMQKRAAHVIMPDVMFCGGPAEAHRAGLLADRMGVGFSPHSPSGTVSLLTSGHVCAAAPKAMPLEHAVAEAPWRHELLDPPERVEDSRLWLDPGPGLGAAPNWAVIERRGRRWTP
jgi:galactonate dehydratase